MAPTAYECDQVSKDHRCANGEYQKRDGLIEAE